MSAPTVISTFAGCGGSSLGYQMAGFRELLAVEWDDNAVATFRLNFPDVPVYHGDIAALSVDECLRLADVAPGDLDILDGSPPCQGFSTLGKWVADDSRNQLFREYVRLLRGLRPKVFVMENVGGLVQGKMRLVFAEIMRELKAQGYRVRAALMNAMYFNVAQDRRRIIIIGVREDLGIAPSHPTPQQRPLAIREVLTPPPGTIGYITARNERHTLAGRRNVVAADRPAPTLVKAGNSRMMMGWRVESITTQEASRLASFPDTFQWRADAMARIGNSVPPNFMRAIAAHIRDHILAPLGQGVAA